LKSVPFQKNFIIMKPDTDEELLKFDLSNSLSIYSLDEKKGKAKISTINLDPKRDLALTSQVTSLIFNIINPRKLLLDNPKTISSEYFFFKLENLEKANKINVSTSGMVFEFDLTASNSIS